MMVAYDKLASVYQWLVPDGLLAPGGAVAAFDPVVSILPEGGRVLDCAAGTGQLAVGLAARGFDVVATDASMAMIERTRALADHHGVTLQAAVCAWEDLARVVEGRFGAVFRVGNSLTHAGGQVRRRAALAQMAALLRAGALLAVTSRNWERLRNQRPGLEIDEHLTHRAGRSGLVVRAWSLPEVWEAPHHLEVAVVVLARDEVETTQERLTFWPFTYPALTNDLQAVGLTPPPRRTRPMSIAIWLRHVDR